MRYYKALEINDNPEFVAFASIANSLEELNAIGEENNPLVVSEDNIPAFLFGRCPLKIVAGALVARTNSEMTAFETAYNLKQQLVAQKITINDINSGTFVYNGNAFAMDEAFRLRLQAVANLMPSNSQFMNINGIAITISNLNFPAFMAAYHSKVKILTEIKS